MTGEKSGSRGEISTTVSLPTTNPTLTDLNSDSIHRGGPAINRPINGTYGKRTKCINVLIITDKYVIKGRFSTTATNSDCTCYFLYSVFYTSHCCFFFGEFTELWKASRLIVSLFLPVRPSVCSHGTTLLTLDAFSRKFMYFLSVFILKFKFFYSCLACYISTMLSAYYKH